MMKKKKKEVGVTGITKEQALQLGKWAKNNGNKVKIVSVDNVPQPKKLH